MFVNLAPKALIVRVCTNFGSQKLFSSLGLFSPHSIKTNIKDSRGIKFFKAVNKHQLFLEIDCPGDGSCSFHGTCDDTTGTCVCNDGFEGDSCQSMFLFFSVL